MDIYSKKIDDLYQEFKTSEQGLAEEEAEKRLTQYGENKLKEKKEINTFLLFLNQFKSFLILILIAATIISFFLGKIVDAIVIFLIVLFNATFGFIQEYKAEKAIAALKKLTSAQSVVIREGKEQKISTSLIVPGDILVLREGDKIPADARLILVSALETQEASLTGESTPVAKTEIAISKEALPVADQINMVFSGTIVTKGYGKALVVKTGMQSEIGKIAKMMQTVRDESTPLQQRLRKLGQFIGITAIIVSIMVFILQIYLGVEKIDAFLLAISLAVAAVPEGLPAVVTIALALGSQRLVKKKALIRRLASVETLGSTSVIGSDKTGTLTKNEMTVKEVYCERKLIKVDGVGYIPEGGFSFEGTPFSSLGLELLLKTGMLCNNAQLIEKNNQWEILGDPTEAALLVSAKKYGLKKQEYKKLKEIPFDASKRYMAAIYQEKGNEIIYVKGAPEVVLSLCDKVYERGFTRKITEKDKQQILETNERMAKDSLRILGFAYKNVEKKTELTQNLIFLGLQGMIDPPKEHINDYIKKCNEAGIKVVMITGDHPGTAVAIAKQIGLQGRVLTGIELDKFEDKEFFFKVESYDVYARVNPEHKLRIVNALKKRGHVVAVTGDGINDAPALKSADIGVAMGITGTEVSKEASDMIIEDDDFKTIVDAVEEGRSIYDNIRKFVNYLLSSNLAEILVIVIAALLGMPLPLIAVQLLWINLVTDGLPALALSVDLAQPGIMKKKPRPKRESFITKKLGFSMITIAILIATATLYLFNQGLQENLLKAQPMAFTSLVVFEIVRLEGIRRDYKLGFFSNRYLNLAILSSLLLQLIVIYTPIAKFFNTVPLSLLDWGYLLVAALVLFILQRLMHWLNPLSEESSSSQSR